MGKEENMWTKEDIERKTTSGMGRPGVQQVSEGSGEQRKTEKTRCKVIHGAPMILVVKGMVTLMISVY